jgi:hypothetical protein
MSESVVKAIAIAVLRGVYTYVAPPLVSPTGRTCLGFGFTRVTRQYSFSKRFAFPPSTFY